MGDISFGLTTDMLKNAISGAAEAQETIANNIANVNTPNFHRSDTTFREALARMEPYAGDPDELSLVTDNSRQIPIGGPEPPEPFSVTTNVDTSEQMRVDGSNVDIDQEMAKLSINSSYSQTMATLLTQQYTTIRKAIQEQT
jgi:flagellar basal-body rod protein FlgB